MVLNGIKCEELIATVFVAKLILERCGVESPNVACQNFFGIKGSDNQDSNEDGLFDNVFAIIGLGAVILAIAVPVLLW